MLTKNNVVYPIHRYAVAIEGLAPGYREASKATDSSTDLFGRLLIMHVVHL